MAEALLDDEVVRVRGSVLNGGAAAEADSAGGENSDRCLDCKFSRGFFQPRFKRSKISSITTTELNSS